MAHELTDSQIGTPSSVLFPGLLNPTGLKTVVSEMVKLDSDNPDAMPLHIRSLRILAHKNVQFGWLMPSHGQPIRFHSQESKHQKIEKHAAKLDRTREKGSKLYERMMQYI